MFRIRHGVESYGVLLVLGGVPRKRERTRLILLYAQTPLYEVGSAGGRNPVVDRAGAFIFNAKWEIDNAVTCSCRHALAHESSVSIEKWLGGSSHGLQHICIDVIAYIAQLVAALTYVYMSPVVVAFKLSTPPPARSNMISVCCRCAHFVYSIYGVSHEPSIFESVFRSLMSGAESSWYHTGVTPRRYVVISCSCFLSHTYLYGAQPGS